MPVNPPSYDQKIIRELAALYDRQLQRTDSMERARQTFDLIGNLLMEREGKHVTPLQPNDARFYRFIQECRGTSGQINLGFLQGSLLRISSQSADKASNAPTISAGQKIKIYDRHCARVKQIRTTIAAMQEPTLPPTTQVTSALPAGRAIATENAIAP